MKPWVIGALCLTVLGFIGHLTQGDGQKAAEALAGGGGLVIILVVVAVIFSVIKFVYGKLK